VRSVLLDQSPRRTLLIALLLVSGSSLIAASPSRASLVWEQHYSDEDALADGSSINTGGTTVTFDRTVFSDNTFFTFDLDPYINSDYFTFEAGELGAHTGYLELSMDNQNDDPDDYLELALNFADSVTNLQFSLLDIDSGSWDDGVEVFYNGSNSVRDNPAIAAVLGSAVAEDNETYMNGWEGIGTGADNDETTGNIDFDFGSLHVDSLTIRYFSTDDADSNPDGQRAGISDLSFTAATPEPSQIACVMIFACGLLCVSLRRIYSDPQAGRGALTASAASVGPPQSC